MCQADPAKRLIIVSDLDLGGERRPVLATSDPVIVEAVETAIRERMSHRPGTGPVAEPGPTEANPATLTLDN